MRRLIAVLAALLVTAALAVPALAHDDDDSQDPETINTSENLSFVEHHWFPQGSDMYFQRREGRQRLNGEVINATKDYLFAGGDGSTDAEVGTMEIFDVTDPTNPDHIANIQCRGYHAEVVVYEDLMIQGIDSAGSNSGCQPRERWDPDQEDVRGHEGIRIFDVSDPAQPKVVEFIAEDELDGGGVHNLNVHVEAGLLYIASSDFTSPTPRWGYVDLNDPEFPVTMMDVKEITPNATAACHDLGLDYERDLAYCAAVEQTFIWDISEPRMPQHVSTIANPDITIHHGARLAPDGTTLVLNDELAGAAFSPGCLGTGSQGAVGALWFYDTTDPANPVPMGSFSTEELSTSTLCTSHFYNFIPGTTLLVVGWYTSGVIVVDYENPSQPVEHAFLRTSGNSSFWSAYYWRGYVYGNSRTEEADGFGGGLWVAKLDGEGGSDRPPVSFDEGTSWSRWDPACATGDVPPSGFGDIAESVHRGNIECIAWYTITQGVTAERYAPGQQVTRGQMASYLARLAVEGGVEFPGDAPDAFEDDTGSAHHDAINAVAELGIASGVGDTDGDGDREFNPSGVVSRAQMATFIANTHELVTGSLPEDPPDAFDDDDGSDHEDNINALAALGVVQGATDSDDVDGDGDTDERLFFPGDPTGRSTMATFLAEDLKLFVEDGKAFAGGAGVSLESAEVAAGDQLAGTAVSNKTVTELVAHGCGHDGQTIEVAGDGSFTVSVGPDQSDTCQLTLAVTTRRSAAKNDQTQTDTQPFQLTISGG